MTTLVFVLGLVLCTGLGTAFGGTGLTTGTSFENQQLGPFSTEFGDDGQPGGTLYWATADTTDGSQVTAYAVGEAYAYSNTTRSALFDKEPAGDRRGTNVQYLAVNSDTTLDRLIAPRLDYEGGSVISNVLIRGGGYDGIYADTLVKFSASFGEPALDEADRIVVWLYADDEVTNLMVTAGHYDGSFKEVSAKTYAIESPKVTVDTWHRLTIRAISDITTGDKAPGFAVYVDGEPAVAAASGYEIGTGYRADRMTAETRALQAARRLFPWIARAGYDEALALSRFSFVGQGGVDDVLFTMDRPGLVTEESVFTLRWDTGVTAIKYTIQCGGEMETRMIDATVRPLYRDIPLGTNRTATIEVEATFDKVHEYSNGVWTAQNDCTVEDNVFTYAGRSINPIGIVASSRDVVGVGAGAGGCETFAEALDRVRTTPNKVIQLLTNVVVSTKATGGKYRDLGFVKILPGDDIILDLNGYTLRGLFPGYTTISQQGGRLRITDSSVEKTGAVLPCAGSTEAVKSYSTSKDKSELIIEGGTYEGTVVIDGKTIETIAQTNYIGTCVIGGGNFLSSDSKNFYLEQFVTNTTSYYGWRDGYWTAVTNGFIWCGAGWPETQWTNAVNWRCGSVPKAGDLAIFPVITDGSDGWDVDFGEGVPVKSMWMDGDIVMAGANEFSDVSVISGEGRISGNGLVSFTGKLPGRLTAQASGRPEIRLGTNWTGTVRISSVLSPKILKDITGWGNGASRVEFNGVRGYLSDKANYALPYELVLTDLVTAGGATTNSAWKNDTGYTGSTVSYPKLTGDGTFESPKNLTAVLQVFQFKDVADFTGRFLLGGKRLLLGSGSVATASVAGHYTFSEGVMVRSGLGWEGVGAHFGDILKVKGELDDVLMTYSGIEPAVEDVIVMLYDPVTGGSSGSTAKLKAEGGKIRVWAGDTLKVSGLSLSPMMAASSVTAGAKVDIPEGSGVTIVGNDIVVGGAVVSSVANYYDVTPVGGEKAYSVEFNEEARPTMADFTLASDDGNSSAAVLVKNVKAGLWYGLQAFSDLATDEAKRPAPSEWVQAAKDNEKLRLSVSTEGRASVFLRVLVTDKNPYGGEK